MSFLQRTASTPFGQVYNATSNWTLNSRPDTTTETWLSTSGDYGYSFSGSGYIFGFMTAYTTSISLGELKVEDQNNSRYQSGFYRSVGVASRNTSDDEAIGYGNLVQGFRGNYYGSAWGDYLPSSRINVIRME